MFGTVENWRPDYGAFPASVMGDSNGWPVVVYRRDTPRPGKDDVSEWYIYVLGDDGRWYASFIFDTSEGAHTMVDRLVPQARAALAAGQTNISSPHGDPPDINDVISPNVPDSQLERQMTVPDVI